MPKLLHTISDERIVFELIKTFKANPCNSFIDLYKSGVLRLILPELFNGESYNFTLDKFRLVNFEKNLSAEFLFSCLLSEIACNEMKVKLEKKSEPEIKSFDPEFYRLVSIPDIVKRLYLPNQRYIINLLTAFTIFVNIDRIKYKKAVAEELLTSSVSKQEITALYIIHKKVMKEEPFNIPQALESFSANPKIVTGNDLKKMGIVSGIFMKPVLRYIRNEQLSLNISDKDRLLSEALKEYERVCKNGKRKKLEKN